jgi:hypothetical protein
MLLNHQIRYWINTRTRHPNNHQVNIYHPHHRWILNILVSRITWRWRNIRSWCLGRRLLLLNHAL